MAASKEATAVETILFSEKEDTRVEIITDSHDNVTAMNGYNKAAAEPSKSTKRERKNRTSEAFQSVRHKILQSSEASLLTRKDSHGSQDFIVGSSDLLNQRATSLARMSSGSSRDLYGSSSLYGEPDGGVNSSDDSKSSGAPHSMIILESEFSGLAITDPTVFEYVRVGNTGQLEYDLKSLDPRVSILGTMSIFAERPDLLLKLRPEIEFTLYEKDTEIQKQGELMKNLYWILDGNCTVSQNVAFVEILTGVGDWVVRPVFEDTKPAGPNEKLVFKNIESQTLDAGSWFPYLSGIEPGVPLCKPDLLDAHSKNPCDCTVTAETRVIVAKISLEVFVEMVSVQMLYNLHQQSSIYQFKHEFLREEYLSQIEFEEKKSKHPLTFSSSISIS